MPDEGGYVVIRLFGHPFSSYTWKALIAFYENDTPFDYRVIDDEHPDNIAEWQRRWPMQLFPLLVDGDAQIFEATSIIEYLEANHPRPVRLIPANAKAAVTVRWLDRVFDNHAMERMQKIVLDARRPVGSRDPYGVDEARGKLDTIYAWLDDQLTGEWAAGDDFTLTDCAAAPSLFYADWAYPIDSRHANLMAYRARLLARPSIARCVDEARPYRTFFPLGAPDRD